MKRVIAFVMIVCMSVCLVGCTLERVVIKNPENYERIDSLSEIRDKEAYELFPNTIADKDVEFFYFQWDLGIVGCATVEYQCSIKYSESYFEKEVDRIENYVAVMEYYDVGSNGGRRIVKNKLVYDEETFCLPAYVAVLGHNGTSAYVLLDEEKNTVHYIHLSVIYKNDMHINKEYLPKGYYSCGDVHGQSYSVYEED